MSNDDLSQPHVHKHVSTETKAASADRSELILKNIELENTVMKFKKGLHLANEVIKQSVHNGSVSAYKAHRKFNKFLIGNKLTDI